MFKKALVVAGLAAAIVGGPAIAAPVAPDVAPTASAATIPDLCNKDNAFSVVAFNSAGTRLRYYVGQCSGATDITRLEVPAGYKIVYTVKDKVTGSFATRTAGGGSATGYVYLASTSALTVLDVYRA